MADSLCGPSNPLQSLQKQTSVDRTLQQDRLIPRPSPIHGFRSSSNAGAATPELERFQAGQVLYPENHGYNQSAFHSHQPEHWVGDFANINLGNSTAHTQHPLQRGNWQAEFEGQNTLNQGHTVQHREWQAEAQRQNTQFSNQGQIQYGPGGQAIGAGWIPSQYRSDIPRMNYQNPQIQPEASHQAAEDPFGKEEWDKLFDEIEQTESSKEQQEHYEPENLEPKNDYQTKRIGADLIINPITDLPRDQRPSRNPDEENEALARTAGNLLNSVSNNQDEKFQNSRFLKLMEAFRDRQVAVQGNKIVSIGGDAGLGEQGEYDQEQSIPHVGVVSS